MTVQDAMDIVTNEIRNDEGYRIAWRSNIAVQFQDACRHAGINFPQLREISNKAAEDFLKLLCRDYTNEKKS